MSPKTQKDLEEGGFIRGLGNRASTWIYAGFIGIRAPDYASGQHFGYSIASYDGGRGASF